ncbi:MAG TPA: four helix bundle protein [Gemmatimonadales bacterium]|nr:four helix bundle protein [Gemmatimonadales bacterium]
MTASVRTPVRSFRDLIVWQRGMDLAVEVYRLTDRLPRSEQFGLRVQARRAASSIPTNIAEGVGRGTTREYLRSLAIANGSLKELETQLTLGVRLQFYESDDAREAFRLAEEVSKMLGALMRTLRKRENRVR